MEKRNYKDMNYILSGAPVKLNPWTKRKTGHVYTKADVLRSDILDLIKIAKNYSDLNDIGSKIAYAKDNDVEIGLFDCAYRASRKMREIYNKLGEYRLE